MAWTNAKVAMVVGAAVLVTAVTVPVGVELYLARPGSPFSHFRPMSHREKAKAAATQAGEFARTFLEACGREDWKEVATLWPPGGMQPDERIKSYLAGLQVVSLGEPFTDGGYPGVFVPYEIRFKNGELKKFRLAIRRDNPEKRWVFDGGL